METKRQSLMEIETKDRNKIFRIISVVLSIPAMGIGTVLLYFGYFEEDYVYLFFYFVMGLAIIVMGGWLFLSSISTRRRGGKRTSIKHVTISKEGARENVEMMNQETCPGCGSKIISAGKFCGNCGASLKE